MRSASDEPRNPRNFSAGSRPQHARVSRPSASASGTSTSSLRSDLRDWELPVTTTLVVSTALATRDFQDVHHDPDLARGHGSKDIFLNILSTTGLVQRYVGECAGIHFFPTWQEVSHLCQTVHNRQDAVVVVGER